MAKKKTKKRGPGRPPGSTSGKNYWNNATSGLHSYRSRLVVDRDALNEKIAAIDGALAALGVAMHSPAGAAATAAAPPAAAGARRGPGRGRHGPRAGSLKEYIANVLGGKGPMAVKDIADAVVKSGYKTKNKTLAKSVGIALADMKNVQKVGRGQYRLK